ncbi:Thiamin biosynthesis lipoprotein ApbE [Microbacterium sp. 8M]|uniref:FAD:protein FMN transferase n=1 Tax=Microbacterium sp. 8M TaxID=2653153 RepID=UPI0012F2314E|nr:FAD:protein FMN transferase [Microbacterium sp. 8M]VXB18619.1 Thiamin biosynthesis lipoprotein ApbE [Microbacterium sp. 8M]
MSVPAAASGSRSGTPTPARPAAPHRQVRTAELMGTVASVHVLTVDRSPAPALAVRISAAQDAAIAQLHEIDALFSPFRPDSQISLLRAGELRAGDADPRIAEVAEACARLAEASGGRFDAHRQGWFDPTGYVKGWAVERAAVRHLAPLLSEPGVVAVALSAGGDMQLLTAADADWTWSIGIADPDRAGELRARIPLREGAVATSGPSERGAHIVDPRTGAAVADAPTATVIADRLSDADAWATVAVVAGFDDLTWLRAAPDCSGVLIAPDGRIRRWTHGVEVVAAEDPDPRAPR